MFIKSIIALLLIASAPFALAHGTGESFEDEIDGYRIDIGYNVEEFEEGQQVLFDFGIETSAEYNVSYTDVWIRILKDNKAVYAGGIFNSDFGGARMTYTFPDDGEYELSVRYQNGGEKIVSASFPISVIPSSSNEEEASSINFVTILIGILGLGIGYGAAGFTKKK